MTGGILYAVLCWAAVASAVSSLYVAVRHSMQDAITFWIVWGLAMAAILLGILAMKV